VGSRIGDLVVLVGVVCVVLLARRNGKRNRVSAIANARAEAYAEGHAAATAAASANNSTTVTVGQASGSGGADVRAVVLAILDELRTADGLRAVRDGSDDSGGRLGRVPELLLLGQDARGDISRGVVVGRGLGSNGHSLGVAPPMKAYDVTGEYQD